jgi:hypothetical protein
VACPGMLKIGLAHWYGPSAALLRPHLNSSLSPLAGSALELKGFRQNPVKIRRRSENFSKNRPE